MSSPLRGDVFIVDFDPVRGSEQGGKRPALVVSNDVGNGRAAVVTVVPITRTIPKKDYPQNVALPAGVLSDAGTIYCGQPLTVSKDRLSNFVAHLPATIMVQVDDALRVHLDLH